MSSITISFPVSAALPFWFLVVSLFIPRIALFVMWLQHQFVIAGLLPLLAAVLVPRILILVLIYYAQGISGWFLIHLLALLLTWGGAGSYSRRRRSEEF